ncbi:MAG TPA: hypothetical protein VL087_03535 [Nitrospirota bacterium]|nr:hypothetical protein [Nitrospirota bacterium]
MNRLRGQILLSVVLIALSAVLYVLQIRIFHSQRDTLFYLFQDLAFVPIQVMLVTVIVDQVLRIREKIAMLNKLNMVIGTFFSEVGSRLLRSFSGFDHHFDQIRRNLIVTKDWTDLNFTKVARDVGNYDYRLDYKRRDLNELKTFLVAKRDFLLRLLENQNLLEHESFTDLLWAVFHLTEELEARESLAQLSRPDGEHIAGDMRRAYGLLIVQWLAYMKHLKKEYPYLFSLAVRTNPFDPDVSVVVK